MAPPSPTGKFGAGDLVFLWIVSACGFVLGAWGIYHYGYMGQDFGSHQYLIVTYPRYDYTLTNPPGLYWLGSLIRHNTSATYYLEILALGFLTLNSASLWILYRLLWRMIELRPLRLAAAALATLVPFRVIHSVVISGDAITLPVFAVAAWCTLRLSENPRRTASWLVLSLCLAAGMLFKYTTVGLLPPIALVLAVSLWKEPRGAARRRAAAWAVLALAVPTSIFLYQMNESRKVGGRSTGGHWLPAGAPAIMRWSDVLIPKPNDRNLLNAPEYFRDKLYEDRAYSYVGLLHLSTFTDPMNLFQKAPAGIPTGLRNRQQSEFQRERTPLSQTLQEWSVRWALPLSVLALLGTLTCGVFCLPSLFAANPRLAMPTAITALMAAGFYAPVFLNLTRIAQVYAGGYWLPRLVLPSVVVFLCLGFVLLDRFCRSPGRSGLVARYLPGFALGYVLSACLLFVGSLA